MNPLNSLAGTLAAGVAAAVLVMAVLGKGVFNPWSLAVWLHVLCGIVWVGLLYYFNLVQVPAVAAASADGEGPGPAAINRYVAPRALFWFRWGAVATWLTGAAALFGYQQYLIRGRARPACFTAFLNNNWVGGVIFAGIAASHALGAVA